MRLDAVAIEGFVDELALAARQDPLAFRLAMLAKLPRQRTVLERAARAADYAAAPSAGRAFGVASMECYETHVALVSEVSGTADRVKLERISVCADCGVAVHPDQAVAQLQGGVVMGLIQALRSRITVKNVRVTMHSPGRWRCTVHLVRGLVVMHGNALLPPMSGVQRREGRHGTPALSSSQRC